MDMSSDPLEKARKVLEYSLGTVPSTELGISERRWVESFEALGVLIELPAEERLALIRNDPDRFRGSLLATLLLYCSRHRGDLAVVDPVRSQGLARAAGAVLQHSADLPQASPVPALCWFIQGDAHARLDELGRALRYVQRASIAVEKHRQPAPYLMLEIVTLELWLKRQTRAGGGSPEATDDPDGEDNEDA